MWLPEYISIKNLFGHVDTKYTFKNGVCTVIFGENRDDDDADNNGAGKSTIFEAIAIALTGKSLRDIDKEVFINRQSDDCVIEFFLTNEVMKSTLGIIRHFYRGGKSTKVEVYEDGEKNAQLTSVNEANARIIELIGVSREDILRYFIISQDNRYQFFTAGDAEKKEVLNRITNADMINPILEKLSADRKELAITADASRLQIDKYEERLNFYREQRANAIAIDDNQGIEVRESKIRSLKTKIKTAGEEKKKLNSRLEDVMSSDDYNFTEQSSTTDKLKEKRSKLRDKISNLEEQEQEANHIIKHLKSDISGAVKCPKCNHKFMPESNYDLTVKEAKQVLKDTEESLDEIVASINKKRNKIAAINDKIRAEEERAERAREAASKAKKIQRDIQEVEDEISRMKKRISELEDEIKQIRETNRSAKVVAECDEKIKEVTKKLDVEKKKLEADTEELSMVDYWIYYMGKTGFLTYLANRSISIIEGIVNSFLKKFHSSMTVEIKGFKVNKNGDVRDKIDVLAVYKGKYAQNFMGYSGGERGRIYLASIMGIQHLINLSTNGRGLGFLLLDESLWALDGKGVVNICNILNQLGVTVLMITQNVSSDVNIANKVLVVREDEVCRIV